jgi:hypothetical protein
MDLVVSSIDMMELGPSLTLCGWAGSSDSGSPSVPSAKTVKSVHMNLEGSVTTGLSPHHMSETCSGPCAHYGVGYSKVHMELKAKGERGTANLELDVAEDNGSWKIEHSSADGRAITLE